MRFYINRETGKPEACFADSIDRSDNANKLCQKETGKKVGTCYNDAIIIK